MTLASSMLCYYGPVADDQNAYNDILKAVPDLRRDLGCGATLSYLLFFFLGITLPAALTGFGADAIVTTLSKQACASSPDNDLQFRKAWAAAASHFQSCRLPGIKALPTCSKNSLDINIPHITIEEISCPFDAAACAHYPSQSLTYDVSLSSLGLNILSKTSVIMQHKVLYPHLQLDSLTNVVNKTGEIYFHDPSYIDDTSYLKGFFSRQLSTLNGPNKYTANFSGGSQIPINFSV
jgi:hypothetical protein